jgi:hypothetical protein
VYFRYTMNWFLVFSFRNQSTIDRNTAKAIEKSSVAVNPVKIQPDPDEALKKKLEARARRFAAPPAVSSSASASAGSSNDASAIPAKSSTNAATEPARNNAATAAAPASNVISSDVRQRLGVKRSSDQGLDSASVSTAVKQARIIASRKVVAKAAFMLHQQQYRQQLILRQQQKNAEKTARLLPKESTSQEQQMQTSECKPQQHQLGPAAGIEQQQQKQRQPATLQSGVTRTVKQNQQCQSQKQLLVSAAPVDSAHSTISKSSDVTHVRASTDTVAVSVTNVSQNFFHFLFAL